MTDAPNAFDGYQGDPAATPLPAAEPAPVPNAFDAFDDGGLKPAEKPGLWQDIDTGFGGAFHHVAAAAHKLIDAGTVDNARANGVAQPGDSPFAGKPSQSEVDAAIGDLAKIKSERAAYDSYEPGNPLAFGLGYAGGMIAAPENMLLPGLGLAGRAVTTATEKIGGEIVGHILGHATEFGLFSAGTDALDQGADVLSGDQATLDKKRLLLSTAMGAALGAGMGGATALIRRLTAPPTRLGATEAAPGEPAPMAPTDAPQAPAPSDPVVSPAPGLDTSGASAPPDPSVMPGESGTSSPYLAPQHASTTTTGRFTDETHANVPQPPVQHPTAADHIEAETGAPLAPEHRAEIDRSEADAAVLTARATPPAEPGLVAQGEGQAEAVKKVWREESPHLEEGATLAASVDNQDHLGEVGRAIGDELGIAFKDPGVKALHPDAIAAIEDPAARARKQDSLDRFRAKSDKLGKPGAVTDQVCSGFMVDTPAQSDAAIGRLAQHFQVIDEGWQTTAEGYFDRKAYVRFSDGMIGEVQFWHPTLFEAKEGTGGGHKLYEEWRALPAGDPRKAELRAQMRALYAGARDSLPADWKAILGNGGNAGNRADQVAGAMTRPDLNASASSTQAPDLNTQMPAGESTKGSPSNVPTVESAGSSSVIGNTSGAHSGGETLLGPAVPDLAPHKVTTAAGRTIDVAPIVVDAKTLRTSADAGYDAGLQPRNRDRAASQAQIRDIATRLDPERLGYSAEADRGAPIVGPDGMVESGNGRVMAIRQVYARGGDQAEAYRAWIAHQGVDVSGMAEPVLVRQRVTPLAGAERQAFTVEANQAATLSMSASERALADARMLTTETLSLIRNAKDLASGANREFVQAFSKGLPITEQGSFADAHGHLTSEGLTRMRNAILAKAYGDSGALVRIAESVDDSVKSISNALVSVAPEWASLRTDIAAGTVRADLDMTGELIEAVQRTADLRAKGFKLDTFLAQQDAFDRIPPAVEYYMKLFYRPDMRRAAGADVIADRLAFYAREARKVSADDGLGFLPPVRREDLMDLAARRSGEGEASNDLFAGPGARDGAHPGARGQDGARPEAGSGGQGAPEARQGSDLGGGQQRPAAGAVSPEAGAGEPGAALPDGQVAGQGVAGKPYTIEDWVTEKTALARAAADETVARHAADLKAFRDGRYQDMSVDPFLGDSRASKTKAGRRKIERMLEDNLRQAEDRAANPAPDLSNENVRAIAESEVADRNQPAPVEDPELETQFLRARLPQGPNAPDRRLSVRQQLPGEASKPTLLPPGTTAHEVRSFKLMETMRDLAARLGRRLETDGRIDPGALGTYKPKEGVLRVKYAGDVDTFSHELGHALDQKLGMDPRTAADWRALKVGNRAELLALDYNASVTGGQPTVAEGVAEFMRAIITNPAYAQKQAPKTFADFAQALAKAPDLAGLVADANRMAHIESGLNPMQVFSSMVAIEPHSGLEKFTDSVRRFGIVPTLKDYATLVYGGLVRENVHFDRLVQFLRDARFQKTGQPIRKLAFAEDPEHLYRQMPAAHQSAVDMLDRGVPLDSLDPLNSARSRPFNAAVEKALNGAISKIENEADPLVRDFNAYLVARRAKGEWELFRNGELSNQPVRASENETLRAIGDFEKAYPNFQDAADQIFAFQRAYLQRRVDKHLISQETANAFLAKRQDHIPLYRSFDGEKAGGGAGGGAGKGLEFGDIKRFGGSTRDIKNVLRSIVEDVGRTERRIAENDVRLAIDNLARDAGPLAGPVWEHIPNTDMKGTEVDVEAALRNLAKANGLSKAEADIMVSNLAPLIGQDMRTSLFRREPTTTKGQRVLFMYRHGERIAVKVGDNEISKHFYDLMTAMSEPEKDVFLKMVGAVNQAFQGSITHAFRFIFGTLVRDNVTRMFIPRHMGIAGRVPFVQDAVGAYTMLVDRSFYRAYQAGGGIRAGLYSHAANELGGDGLGAVAASTGYVSKTLDAFAQAQGAAARANVLRSVPAGLVRAGLYYGASHIDRVRYAEGKLLKAWAIATTPGRMMSDVLKLTELGETASRLGGAKLTFNHLKKQGLSDVDALAGALYESRDVLNYNSHGEWTRKLARLAPFINAGVTGADRSARGLVAEPIMAAARALERGGWDKLDIADQKVLQAAWKNWLYVASAAGVGAAVYYPMVKDTEFYRRSSDYMRRTYYLIQTGTDADGNPVGLTIHKGYDIPAAIQTTAELASEQMRRDAPADFHRIFTGLEEAIPRQFRSFSEFISGFPMVKLPYELETGMKMGFDGSPARPIVPERLKGLPIEQQTGAMTSWLAKKIGGLVGTSPIVVDHVLSSFGTGASDLTDLSSAVLDNNPLVSPGDALNRFFFGQIYRAMKSDVNTGHDLRDLMARDTGAYTVQARGYRDALEAGNQADADSIFNRADKTAQAYMVLQSSYRFKPEVRDLHPLQRSNDIADAIYGMLKNLGKGVIVTEDRSHKKGDEREIIELDPSTTRQVAAQLNMILAEETRNGLAAVHQPGYDGFDIIDTAPRIQSLKEIDPDVAAELQSRLKRRHVLPAAGVATVWPQVQQRLVADRDKAKLTDLLMQAKRPAGTQ